MDTTAIRQMIDLPTEEVTPFVVYQARQAAAEIADTEFPTEEQMRSIFSRAVAMLDSHDLTERQMAVLTIISICDFYFEANVKPLIGRP